jgi:hypothetical protein
MCWPGKDVISRNVLFFVREPIRYQELLYGEMRELHNWGTLDVDDRDEARTCRYHRFLSVLQAPVRVIIRKFSFIKSNGKNFSQLLDTKRSK